MKHKLILKYSKQNKPSHARHSMIESMKLWKLPKYERSSRLKKIEELRAKIEDLKLTIVRDEARLDWLKYSLSKKQKELEQLENP